MKYFMPILTVILSCLTGFVSVAQKQSFDMVSYTAPKGWQQVQNEGGMQLSVTDKITGGYAIAIITKAIESHLTASASFNTEFERLLKTTVQVTGEPDMQEPATENGWQIISGHVNYTDGAQQGVATLITAAGGNHTVSVVLMTNTRQFQDELLSFTNSLELAKLSSAKTDENNSVSANTEKGSSVTGLWTNYVLETTGYSVNGMAQYTAGYLRKEYAFYPDGTYQFRNKQWLTKAPRIIYMYETGTYTVSGNQITLTAHKSKSGFWNKTKSTKEWGSLVKYTAAESEKTTYTFQLITDKDYGNSIVLQSNKPTIRDGGQFNAPGDPLEFHYRFRDLESLIDNPPGLKTGFENKSFTAAEKNHE